ncbi:hypothetical protein RAH41_14130 [Gottfriedia acidiceleris]|uniref:hypothetical protein n=1 Tax=Gottfriedia acidiceleris TaxID=371036 RepID=UPI002F26590F
MIYNFITRVHDFKIDKVLNKGTQIFDNMRLSNSRGRLETMVDSGFESMIGSLEFRSLIGNPFIYSENELPDSFNYSDEDERLNLLNSCLITTQKFASFLWVVKDNSVSIENGFLYIKQNDGMGHSVSSNMRSSLFYNASGQREETVFSDEEIRTALKFYNYIFDDSKTIITHDEVSKTIINNSNRIERFFYFLQATRSQTYLPNRISMYCTLLETLLSTDNTEISHKISERTAFILGNTFEERDEIYKLVKKAYSIRSSTVHGDTISKSLRSVDTQREISVEIDNYLRHLFLKILSNEETSTLYLKDNKDDLNKWFNKLIFS